MMKCRVMNTQSHCHCLPVAVTVCHFKCDSHTDRQSHTLVLDIHRRMNRLQINTKTSIMKIMKRYVSMSSFKDNDIVVCAFARTPITSLGGNLSSMTAPKLGAAVISNVFQRSGLTDKNLIEEVFMGNVVSANIGQAPSRQAAIYADLPLGVATTDINKVCASGMKAVMFAALSISSGYRNSIIAGGMESMSNIPYYLPGARSGYRLGNQTVVDGLVNDGLWDIYNNQHMGNCGEDCASKFNISRKDQDDYAIESYKRASDAWNSGKFNDEVIEIKVESKRGETKIVNKDDEYINIKLDKLSTLKPAFKKDGTVTAANASKLNDGAAAMLVVSGKFAKDHNLTPLFKIRGFGDACRAPIEFTIAPSDAIPRALKHAGVALSDVDYHEMNEAFSVVPIANAK